MSMTDPIADMLTRIRNAVRNSSETVDMPSSAMKEGIAAVLKDEGYVADFRVAQGEGSPHKTLRVYLKYGPEGEKVINVITRVSKPGRRVYSKADDLPHVLDGLGISIVTTSKGVLSDRKCRQMNIGGEVLCRVW
jgi:small subunit ribosomal protein S8